jgi:putrescine transport system ATP-binding protein
MADGILAEAPDAIFCAVGHPAGRQSAPFLRIQNVSKRFGAFTAIDGLSLDIARGEFFALLGPSGCGKSTLLRMLAGLETSDTGEIVLDGENLAGRPPHLRPVNMMFQSYALFPHMTVEGNIGFGLRQEALPRGEIAERVADMLTLMQLTGLGGRKPHQLSGGQRQRVALARALVKRPKALLLDEPLAALDKRLREETQSELSALQRRLGTTFVIVTHDQEEAMTLADRMAVMDHGRIAQIGTPAEIYEQPNSRTVARFIGDINLLEGTIARTDAQITQIDCGLAGNFRVTQAARGAAGSAVALALRPEKLWLAAVPPSDPDGNALRGAVTDIAYRGERSIYRVRTITDLMLSVAVSNPTRKTETRHAVGDNVWVTWPPDAGVLLDR